MEKLFRVFLHAKKRENKGQPFKSTWQMGGSHWDKKMQILDNIFTVSISTSLSPKIMEVENGCSWKVSNGKYYMYYNRETQL